MSFFRWTMALGSLPLVANKRIRDGSRVFHGCYPSIHPSLRRGIQAQISLLRPIGSLDLFMAVQQFSYFHQICWGSRSIYRLCLLCHISLTRWYSGMLAQLLWIDSVGAKERFGADHLLFSLKGTRLLLLWRPVAQQLPAEPTRLKR